MRSIWGLSQNLPEILPKRIIEHGSVSYANGRLCTEKRRCVFAGFEALQKAVALVKSLAIRFRNADWLSWGSLPMTRTPRRKDR
jgi:hypothetical protein